MPAITGNNKKVYALKALAFDGRNLSASGAYFTDFITLTAKFLHFAKRCGIKVSI